MQSGILSRGILVVGNNTKAAKSARPHRHAAFPVGPFPATSHSLYSIPRHIHRLKASESVDPVDQQHTAEESLVLPTAGGGAKSGGDLQSNAAKGATSSTSTSTSTSTPPSSEDPSKNNEPTVEAVEAALGNFYRGAAEIFKLAVLLPLRYLILAPLSWALTRLGLLAVNPTDVIRRLETTNAASPLSAPRVAAVLRTLNRHHPHAVVEFVESRNLLHAQTPLVDGPNPSTSTSTATAAGASTASSELSGTAAASTASPTTAGAPPSNRFAVDVEVVREYLIALVKSGRIKEYGSGSAEDAAEALLAGQSHRSMPRLFAELQSVIGGAPLPSKPGETTAWPLHVVLHGNGVATMRGQPQGAMATLQSWFWFFATCMLLGFTWAVGAAAVRRYTSGGASPSGIGPSMISGGPGIAATGGSPGGMFSTKEYSKENIPEKSVKKFSDVKGVDEAVTELEEIVQYLKNPDKFTRLGGKLPKGVLLTGPPGTGKTLLARAVAGEAGVPFFYKAGSEFDEMFVGVGSRRVRSMFAAAKKKAPCIVFIDEIDAVGGKRTSWDGSGGSRKTLNQLLTDMDGFEENSGVVVMAATNLPDLLDSALTRPGRFDRQVAVALPDVRGRQQIIELYLKGKPIAKDVDAHMIARRTPGFSGAQLFNLVNEGALLAARYDANEISAALFDEARDKVLMGSPRSLVQSEEARTLTAYHEGGHALVALYTAGAKPIHKATIIARGHALGMVSQVPDKDEYSTTRQQMMAHIDVCMGGKAAEELIFGEDHVTSGATSDLKTATRLARHMVEDCGMSARIGPVALEEAASQGPEVRRAADEEIGSLLKAAYERVANMLKARESELHTLAAALLEKETLTQREIKELLWGAEAVAAEEAALEAAEAVAGAASARGSLLNSNSGGSGSGGVAPETPKRGGDVAAPVQTSNAALSSSSSGK